MDKIFPEEIIKPPLSDDTLAHYGVLGMKWGVRKDVDRAYSRASAKLDRLKKRAGIRLQKRVGRISKKASRANRVALKASKRYQRALNKPLASKKKLAELSVKRDTTQNKAFKLQAKADKMVSKSAKATKRQVKWERQMAKAFANTKYGKGGQQKVSAEEKKKRLEKAKSNSGKRK